MLLYPSGSMRLTNLSSRPYEGEGMHNVECRGVNDALFMNDRVTFIFGEPEPSPRVVPSSVEVSWV